MSDFIDDGLMKDFFDEAALQIEMIEDNLLILEKDNENKNSIDEIFRAAHTLKGGSASVQMEEITEITHILEDSMEEVRNGNVKINSNIIDILLKTLDIIKNMINERNKGKKYKKDFSDVIDDLKSIIVKKGNSREDKSKKTKKRRK
jgi:two-component system, chemotaxis family, sensor kinase CheA